MRVHGEARLHAPFPAGIEDRLRDALKSRGIRQLYARGCGDRACADEAECRRDHANRVRQDRSVTTRRCSAPFCATRPPARCLFFPTKALAGDQLAELHELSTLPFAEGRGEAGRRRIGVFTYDGDTPQDARRAIRSRAHIVLTNPDMMHSGILPHHPRWAKLFENLRYVVIDELHAYRGVFGSHLTNVLRRLRRICQHYGSSPTFICSSATIANPRELAESLVEQPFELVSENGAPRGEKFFLFVNPPVVSQQLGIRRSYLSETRRIAGEFLKRDLQSIVFAQSRLSTELLTTYLKDDFEDRRARARGSRVSRRPQRRREKGPARESASISSRADALELGIDIGALDVCVMASYPGDAATWQPGGTGRAPQPIGRSARRERARSTSLSSGIRPTSSTRRRQPDQSRQPAHLGPYRKCAAFSCVHDVETSAARRSGGAQRSAESRLHRAKISGSGRARSIPRTRSACSRFRRTTRRGGYHSRRRRHRRDQLPAVLRRCTKGDLRDRGLQ